ncbi:MAG: preprotein translocase subunit SecG [Planctomycetia bacterium]|nr:preprotein translocase subunit SecG [Planctomycetia bacterium]
MIFLIKTLLFIISVFLILLVLVQRGRGGGLAGALGGMGGQSAFGTKAGDLFTRVTIIVAAVWILLCAASVKYFRPSLDTQFADNSPAVTTGVEPGVPLPNANPPAATAPAGTAPAPVGTAPAGSAPAATGTGS